VWETVDPDGRRVALTWSRWSHIRRKHRNLGIARDVLLDIVAAPDERISGREEGEEWFYRRGVGPSAWVKVVVHFDREHGVIATAFPRRSFP